MVNLVLDLAAAWPREQLQPETVAIYADDLSDIPTQIVGEAVRVLRRTSEFFPTIRAIREAAAEVALALPSEDEALRQVGARIAWGKLSDAGRRPVPDVHPDVRDALDHVGGYYAFRTATEPTIVRGQFLKIYREIRAGRIRAAQIDGFALQLQEAS